MWGVKRMKKERIGFIGLGLMGKGMVRNLLSADYRVIGYDISPSEIAAVIEMGAEASSDPADLVDRVDLIMLSLPNSKVVEDVILHALKLPEKGRRGLVVIDTTTADPLMSAEMAAGLKTKGIEMLDATISGTSKMCAERDVTFMVGGSRDVYKDCEPVFATLGRRSSYLGKNGSGALMKLIVNLVLGLNRMVLAEGLSLGKKAGMDQNTILEVLKNSAAYSRAMDMKGLKMIDKDFLPPEGKLAFHLKDVRLILDLASRLDFPLPLSSLHAQALTSQVAKGRGEWDNSGIIAFYNELANI
ncbi:MAG: NAD(P)-dependent oxidoreductase [Desulfobacteraceae bacterium]|nr:MAG: NAD(P)-dependent oxidoreductase [Desulfobacteraceae bacterium]